MSATQRLWITVAEAALLLTLMSWAFALLAGIFMPQLFSPHISHQGQQIAAPVVVLLPDVLATWWLFRMLSSNRSRSDARRAATAFAVSAPLVLALGHVLGTTVGGYAEVFLGSRFILPSVASFVIILMIFVPSGVVMWAVHPSGGLSLPEESIKDEHC